MKRNVGPAKALAVILSASLALSPSITAFATSGEDTAALLTSEETESAAEESSVEVAAEDEADAENQETVEVEESTEDSEAVEAVSDEESPLFEKIDSAEEGLASLKDALDGEVAELPVEEKDPEEETRVIIVMEGDSVLDKGFDTENLAENNAAMNLSDAIVAEQEETIEKIEEEVLDGESLDVNYNLSIITNAVSADVAYKDIANIQKVEGVEAVYVAQKYEPMEEANPQTVTAGEMVGSYTSWATGYTGAGTRIAIIDTGIDSDHPSFDAGAYLAHLEETAEANGKTVADYNLLTAEEIEAVLPNLNASQRSEGVTADDLFVNDKIAYAFNYVDKNLDITHDNDEEGDHGTHVSGIATANYYVPNAQAESGYSRQEIGVTGVAPDAQLITMKVFGTNGGAYSDDYMAAIEDALLLKADVVNLSLGSSAAGYSADSEAYVNEVFEKLEGTSTVVSISAGNSGRWSDDSTYGANLSEDVNQDTVGSPGSYYNAFTVASAVNTSITAKYFESSDGQNIFYSDGNDTLAPAFASLDVEGDGTEYPFVLLRAKGEPADFEGVDVEGKIVAVQRGTITFGEKQMNAEAAGAVAVVIYNNQPGTINMTLQGSTAVIPAVSITLADGEALAAGCEEVADGVYEGTITVVDKLAINYNVADGYTMSTFSSYGVPGTLDLKPEITAPGGNIYSTTDNGTYGQMSGTSMAAPSISGQSALVEQYIRENGLADKTGLSVRTLAQSLMMSTAIPLHEDNDADGLEYSPRSQGAGLGNAYKAISSPAYILVGDKEGNDGKVKAVLGDDAERTGNYSFSFDVYNLTDVPQYYLLDASVLTEQLYAAGELTYFVGSSHKLNPNVSLTADNTVLVYDVNEDGVVNKADKIAFLKAVNGSLKNTVIDAHQDYFDINKDGVVDTKDVYAFGKSMNGKGHEIDLNLAAVKVTDKTTVNVNINLSESDRNYLANFKNGMYVDGFVYVNGLVDLSVPFLAFYGSWADSSMYEPFDFMEYAHNKDYAGQTYSGVEKTNFLSIFPMGIEDELFYTPNLFVDDEKYIPERNAISAVNGSVLGAQYYSLIRNASRVITTIKDKNTGEVYFEDTKTENYASFTYNGQWQNYLDSTELAWAATDADGKPLEDGTEVEITMQAIPSYYDDVEDPTTLKNEGLYLTTPMVVDNTEPEIVDMVPNAEDPTKYDVTVQDNQFVAALMVIDKNGDILQKVAINQEEKGVESVVTIDMPEAVFYIDVFDYACNGVEYRINNTGHEETEYVDSITIDQGDEITLETWVMDSWTATVGPEWLAEGCDEVIWSSSDDDVCYTLDTGLFLTWDEGECIVTATTKNTTVDGEHLTAQIKVIVDDSAAYGGSAALPEELPEDVPAEFRARYEQIKAARSAKDAKDEEPEVKADEAASEASSEASSVVEEKVDDAAVVASSEEAVVDEAAAEASEEEEEADQATTADSEEVVEDQAVEAGSNEEVVGGENDD